MLQRVLNADAFVPKAEFQNQIAQARGWSNAHLSAHSMTVNRTRNEVFAVCRRFSEYPQFSQFVAAVTLSNDAQSEWTITGPKGVMHRWTIQLTEDRADEVLAWACEADVQHVGRITFRDAPANRGTELHIVLAYEAARGALDKVVKTVQRREPSFLLKQEMRRLKQFLETGEVSTTSTSAAAPRGQH